MFRDLKRESRNADESQRQELYQIALDRLDEARSRRGAPSIRDAVRGVRSVRDAAGSPAQGRQRGDEQ